MSDTIMAEEMQAPKKVAFANRKYTNEEKLQKEEKELEQLIAEQKVKPNQKKQNLKAQKKSRLRNVMVIYAATCKTKKKNGQQSLITYKVN